MFFKRIILNKIKNKLKKTRKKFQDKIEIEQNKLISILNHDIKTPLLAQIQGLEYIIKNNDLKKESKDILKEILKSNYFLLEIVANTLFLTKFENENPKLNIQKINILKEIEDCCNSVRNLAYDKKQNIIIKTKKNIKLDADKKMIQKIIFNLITSSMSYGFENSNIEIYVKENKESISFKAKNKSIYMTKEKLNSLFEEKKSSCDFNQLGMSLNLNVAKKLINAHNWDIILESNKNNSSTFGFIVKK